MAACHSLVCLARICKLSFISTFSLVKRDKLPQKERSHGMTKINANQLLMDISTTKVSKQFKLVNS